MRYWQHPSLNRSYGHAPKTQFRKRRCPFRPTTYQRMICLASYVVQSINTSTNNMFERSVAQYVSHTLATNGLSRCLGNGWVTESANSPPDQTQHGFMIRSYQSIANQRFTDYILIHRCSNRSPSHLSIDQWRLTQWMIRGASCVVQSENASPMTHA